MVAGKWRVQSFVSKMRCLGLFREAKIWQLTIRRCGDTVAHVLVLGRLDVPSLHQCVIAALRDWAGGRECGELCSAWATTVTLEGFIGLGVAASVVRWSHFRCWLQCHDGGELLCSVLVIARHRDEELAWRGSVLAGLRAAIVV